MSYNDRSEYGGGGSSGDNYYDRSNDYSDDYSSAAQHANRHAENNGGGSSGGFGSLFSEAASFLGNNHQQIANEDLDEQAAVHAHQKVYGGQSSGGHDANTIGSASMMQALQQFTSMGGSQSGGNSKNQFIGMAMAEAEKLWEQQNSNGNAVSRRYFC